MREKITFYLQMMIFLCTISISAGCRRVPAGEMMAYEDTEDKTATESFETEYLQNVTEEENELIYVYVCGQVKNPGVYCLSMGARVYEAIEMAGGILTDASPESLNLAQLLTDGEKIYIPLKGEEVITSEESDGLVNINTAGADELKGLPGIGEAKAKAIIAYREKTGSFSDIQDILEVPGIGEGLFSQIRDQIKVN